MGEPLIKFQLLSSGSESVHNLSSGGTHCKISVPIFRDWICTQFEQWCYPSQNFSCYLQWFYMYILWVVEEPLVKCMLPSSDNWSFQTLSIPSDSCLTYQGILDNWTHNWLGSLCGIFWLFWILCSNYWGSDRVFLIFTE